MRLLSATPEWTLWGEDYDDRLWLHCTVHRWTPGVRKRLRATLDGLNCPLWVLDNDYHLAPNLPRFLIGHMGFQVSDLMAVDGMIRTAFRRDAPARNG